ncbi:MAG: hypothetical protein U9R79_07530 [Armatimonadota bacterium]|nr:hypothetical protein [Armatimonadota bacterium]
MDEMTLTLPVQTWTPKNGVVKATGDDIILHHADDTSHTISWNIIHHVGDGIDPRFTVTVDIYDLQGNAVAQLTQEDVETGEGNLAWDTDLPEENGIYTYRISAAHEDGPPALVCGPEPDKSWRLEISDVSVSDFAWIDGPPTEASVTLHYELNREAGACDLDIYNHDLEQVSIIEPAGGGQLDPGNGAHQCTVEFKDPDQIVGIYRFVVSALETDADGQENRDQQPKLTLQTGSTIVKWPKAYNVPGEGGSSASFAAAVNTSCYYQSHGGDGTQYSAQVGRAVASTTYEAFDNCAVFQYIGHAAANHCALQQVVNHHQLRGGTAGENPNDNDSVNDIYYLEKKADGALELCRFVFFVGCHTAADNAAGSNLLDAASDKGVDCSAGFEGDLYVWAMSEGIPLFWDYVMSDGAYVDAAAIQVIFDLRDENDGDDGGWGTYASRDNVTLLPAKWGE